MAGSSKYKSKYQYNPFAPQPNEANQQSTSVIRRESEPNPFLPSYNEETSAGHNEDHPLLADSRTVVATGLTRSTFGTVCSLCFVFPYIALVVAPLVVIGFLAPSVETKWQASCGIVIIGEAIITILAIGLILAALIKTVRGKWLSRFLICDFVLLVIITCVSLIVSIVLSIVIQECVAKKDDSVIKVTVWIIWLIAVVLLVFQCVLAFCGYKIRRRSRTTSVSVAAHDYNYN